MLIVEDHPKERVDNAFCGFWFTISAAIWGWILLVNDVEAEDSAPIGAGPAVKNLPYIRGMEMPSSGHTPVLTLFRATVVLAILLLAAHAPLFLNDGVVMDDWLVFTLRPDSPIDINFLIKSAGHPVFFGYYSIANMTGTPVLVMKAMAIVAILSGAISLFLAATRTGLLSRAEAVGVALLVWTYPGYQMWAGKANSVYVFSFGLFFVGVWLLTLAFKARGLGHFALRIAAVLVFFFSFALNSIMVLYAFAMLGLFVAVWRGNDRARGPVLRLLSSAWRCASRYPEFVVLPLVYWGALNIWFKRVGVYAGHYDAHLPTLAELLDGWRAFFRFGYGELSKSAIRAILESHVRLAVVCLTLILAIALARLKGKPSRVQSQGVAPPLLLGLLLFFALSLPYLVAGLRPGENFYESRHLLLFGLPLALWLLAAKRFAATLVGDRAAMVGVLGLASILSIAMLWNGYVFLQARALQQQALEVHLERIPKPDATVFNLIDGFMDYSSRHVALGIPEVTGILRLAWGDHPFLGFTLRAERPTVLQEMEVNRTSEGSAYRNIDPSGPQATISLLPGPAAAPNEALARHYYACRLLAKCDVSALLDQLATVKVDVGPIGGVTPLAASK